MKEQTVYLVMDGARHVKMVFARYEPAKEWADKAGCIVVGWDMVL